MLWWRYYNKEILENSCHGTRWGWCHKRPGWAKEGGGEWAVCVDSSDSQQSEPTGFACRSGKQHQEVEESAGVWGWAVGTEMWGVVHAGPWRQESEQSECCQVDASLGIYLKPQSRDTCKHFFHPGFLRLCRLMSYFEFPSSEGRVPNCTSEIALWNHKALWSERCQRLHVRNPSMMPSTPRRAFLRLLGKETRFHSTLGALGQSSTG